MSEAAEPDIERYATFNDFFTRALKPGARPLAAADYVWPVDGAISQFGAIERDQIFQAKGHAYSTTALLGGDARLAAEFEHGQFATLYLSPRDYHRIHMPLAGRLTEAWYVPGRLFSVNHTTARHVAGLFARNERVVCAFDGAVPFALVLVGALNVGSMETVWRGEITPRRPRSLASLPVDDPRTLERGAEMGRFNMGSTVILLLPPGRASWEGSLASGRILRVGERIGRLEPQQSARG